MHIQKSLAKRGFFVYKIKVFVFLIHIGIFLIRLNRTSSQQLVDISYSRLLFIELEIKN